MLSSFQSTSPFIAGDRLTIADMAIFVFAHSTTWCGVDINEFPHVRAWHDKLAQRPAFQKAVEVPVPFPFSNAAVVDPAGQDFYFNMRKYGGQFIKGSTEEWRGEVVPVPSDHVNYEGVDSTK